MMKRLTRWIAIGLSALTLIACGGGGGSGGSSLFGGGSGGGGTGNAAIAIALDVQRTGASTTSVSSSETVQAVATVTSSGSPVQGVVVTFSESGPGLLTLAPTSGTALTDAQGRASIDVAAANAAIIGATTGSATATVSQISITASKAFQLATSAGGVGAAPAAAAAINFVSASPSGTAIVIKGAGGSGRSESATLTFKVVDGSAAPIDAAKVSFQLNQTSKDAGVVLNTASSSSNSSGFVTTSVTSGSLPTTVIVTATVTSLVTPAGTAVSSQSDAVIVSNDVAVPEAFEIVAAKYNLDGRFTGDSTTISVFIADTNGNPVADGVAVSFVTDAGAVATSTLGGCLTVNGTCDVTFRVQEPRGTGLATVVATALVGNSLTLSESLVINMAGSNSAYIAYEDLTPAPSNPVETVSLGAVCTKTFELLLTDGSLADGSGRSPAAGTTITAENGTSGVTATVKSGTPVPDTLGGGFPSVPFTVEVAIATGAPASCNAAGAAAAGTGFFYLNFTTPNNLVFKQRVGFTYPK